MYRSAEELSDFVVPCHNCSQRWTGYQIGYCCCNNITRYIALHTEHVEKQLCQSVFGDNLRQWEDSEVWLSVWREILRVIQPSFVEFPYWATSSSWTLL